jgi:hypothetical protein
MICPGIAQDCDNPGCRHGGCQGRPPQRSPQPTVVAVADAFARIHRDQAIAPAAALDSLPPGRPI